MKRRDSWLRNNVFAQLVQRELLDLKKLVHTCQFVLLHKGPPYITFFGGRVMIMHKISFDMQVKGGEGITT